MSGQCIEAEELQNGCRTKLSILRETEPDSG